MVKDILLASLLSVSTGCNIPITAALEKWTLPYVLLNIGISSDFEY